MGFIMEHKQNLTQAAQDRQARLWLWMRENGVSFAGVARSLDVSGTIVRRWVNANTIPKKRLSQLISIGFPAELLPEGKDVLPGPKPGWKQQQ